MSTIQELCNKYDTTIKDLTAAFSVIRSHNLGTDCLKEDLRELYRLYNLSMNCLEELESKVENKDWGFHVVWTI